MHLRTVEADLDKNSPFKTLSYYLFSSIKLQRICQIQCHYKFIVNRRNSAEASLSQKCEVEFALHIKYFKLKG